VDATSHALAALSEGTLLGTVLNDGDTMGDAALHLALLLVNGTPVDAASFPYPLDRGVYVWIPSRKVTAETVGP
jgi:methyl-galactoside transport system substrate-binding protein